MKLALPDQPAILIGTPLVSPATGLARELTALILLEFCSSLSFNSSATLTDRKFWVAPTSAVVFRPLIVTSTCMSFLLPDGLPLLFALMISPASAVRPYEAPRRTRLLQIGWHSELLSSVSGIVIIGTNQTLHLLAVLPFWLSGLGSQVLTSSTVVSLCLCLW